MFLSATDYFQAVQEQCTLDDIAQNLGLHKNTISRWQENDHVPTHYIGDFKRLLGDNTPCDLIDKDQFYTNDDAAKLCYNYFLDDAQKLGVNLKSYTFIEPSAGTGSFYNLLPPSRRIGIDIEPKCKGIKNSDFLSWKPPANKKYIVIGNPPFGLRGHLALQFINYSNPFADMVGFILPQLFESDGKGVPAKRVKGYELVSSRKLPANSFYYPNGEIAAIHTIFQVWSKINTHKIKRRKPKTCKDFVKIYSLSNGGTPASTRNKKMIGKCNVYIPSTCFTGMKAYIRFADLPNKRGYGVVIHKNKTTIKALLFNNNWQKVAFCSTNSAVNMRTSLIEKVVIKGGFYDK